MSARPSSGAAASALPGQLMELRRKNLSLAVDRMTQKNVSAFARLIGRRPSQLGEVLNGKRPLGEKLARDIEKRAGLEPLWLDSARSDIRTTAGVPEIDIRRGTSLEALEVDGGADEVLHWWICPVPHSRKTFVLRVVDDSMVSPGPTSNLTFQKGELIYVDPEVDPRDGDAVIFRWRDKLHFRVYAETSDGVQFQALNPNWPKRYIDKLNDMHIVGTVICKVCLPRQRSQN